MCTYGWIWFGLALAWRGDPDSTSATSWVVWSVFTWKSTTIAWILKYWSMLMFNHILPYQSSHVSISYYRILYRRMLTFQHISSYKCAYTSLNRIIFTVEICISWGKEFKWYACIPVYLSHTMNVYSAVWLSRDNTPPPPPPQTFKIAYI